MPTPRSADIATELATSLDAATFSKSFASDRTYNPEYELKDKSALKVSIVAKAERRKRAARGVVEIEIDIDIAVQQGVDKTDATQSDALGFLVEEITEHVEDNFKRVTTGGDDFAHFLSNSNPLWHPAHLKQFEQYTNVTTHTFRTTRETA